MAKRRNLLVGESNRLKGFDNDHVLKLKMRAIFRSANLWEVAENEISHLTFPTILSSKREVTKQ